MEVVFNSKSEEDIEYWKSTGNKSVQSRITKLLLAIADKPFTGIGKPEALKHDWSGCWSLRINLEHRLIYKVENDFVLVLSLRDY